MTRAKDKLTLGYAKRRMRYGNVELTEPSRFLDEIDPVCIGTKTRAAAEKRPAIPVEPPRNIKPFTPLTHAQAAGSSGVPGIAVGQTVEHDRFGRGIVVKLDGPDNDLRAVVRFPGKGDTTLLLRYAKLSVVN
jgi:DNA helicase-2/ATP-dependent DNA helicase PcrA